jgi:hypothetical protein
MSAIWKDTKIQFEILLFGDLELIPKNQPEYPFCKFNKLC